MKVRYAAALFAVALAAIGCAGDGGDDATSSNTPMTSTTAPSSNTDDTSATTSEPGSASTSSVPTTAPDATDTAAVTVVFQQLMNRYDAAVEGILADPRVADDPSNDHVVAYQALFVEGSTFAAGTLAFWSEEGAAGRFYRPGPRGRMYESTVQSVTAESADEATVVVCTWRSIVIVNEAGAQQSAEAGINAGSVNAVRIDGTWMLQDLTRIAPDVCPDPRDQP